MNYIGKRVKHIKIDGSDGIFGEGTIIEFVNDKKSINISFDNLSEIKTFQFPGSIGVNIHLLDPDAKEEAEILNKKIEAQKKSRQTVSNIPIKRPDLNKDRPKSNYISTYENPYDSIIDFCNSHINLIRDEISSLKNGKSKHQLLYNGKFIAKMVDKYIYNFESESELHYPDNTYISIYLPGKIISANIVSYEEFTVTVSTKARILSNLEQVRFSIESWKLLEPLIDRLNELKDKPSPIVRDLVCEGKNNISRIDNHYIGQSRAIEMSNTQPITFIWGPPGTGKTETLANIALDHLSKGHKILMVSYSNISVDGAIKRVHKKDKNLIPGKIIRYGYPRDKKLLDHPYLTSYNYALFKNPHLLEKRKEIIEKRKTISKDSSEYIGLSNELSKIRSMLLEYEKHAVKNADFVATTVSKAYMDPIIYNSHYDVVIFDEASMAYVSQVVFAASLTKSNFVCLGDFAQLPPIVVSGNESELNTDVFDFCSITKAVQTHKGHNWLCLLDTQYRMHPDIATLASVSMYSGLLKSAPNLKEERNSIFESKPFSNMALGIMDLSGSMSTCIKTNDGSRINVLSALISMSIASSCAINHSIGVIAPYNAQARLMYTISRDIQQSNQALNKITCATVHQFQGSEQDIIIYDAVECYREKQLGIMLNSSTNNYANRLFNVALTRAKGKFISVANIDYLKRRSLPRSRVFRQMIDRTEKKSGFSNLSDIKDIDKASNFDFYTKEDYEKQFISDLNKAKQDIYIDIPENMDNSHFLGNILKSLLEKTKNKSVKLHLRVENIEAIPYNLRYFFHKDYICNPIVIIDNKITWFGAPPSNARFKTSDGPIPTKYRPIIRFEGQNFARSLCGFLGMNKKYY